MRPFFRDLGITRVARQTGLDCIGIPCFAAIRPNAATLAVNQGKGTDDDAAEASAVMEPRNTASQRRRTSSFATSAQTRRKPPDKCLT
jgi:ribosomal protein S12 methylthiotransferase accessory factor